MALPSYKALLDDPKFQSASVDEQNQLNDKYWSLYDKENPGDPWAQQMRTATYGLFGTKKQLADAPPIKQRELDLQREAFNFSVNLGVADKEGMWSSPEQRLEAVNAKQADFDKRKVELDKTMSLFRDPKVDEAMQPAWQALTSSASMGEVFNAPDTWSDTALKGVSYVASAGGSSERRDKARADYDKYRSTMAQDFGLTTDEVDDLVKHRLDKQPDPVSQDVAGTVHFRTDLLVRPTSEIEQAIADSKLPDSVKETARTEAPQKIALFKTGVLNRVKKDYPELADDMTWTGKTDEDYATLQGKLNKDWVEQLGGGVAGAALTGVLAEAGRGSEFGVRDVVFGNAPGSDVNVVRDAQGNVVRMEKAPTLDEKSAALAKKQQAVNELSSFINSDKTKIFNVDAATVGQGTYSVLESVAVAAATGGLGDIVVPAARLEQAGKVGKALLGFSKRALNTAPVAGIYGAEQGLQTYEQALASDDPNVRANAANLALGSAAIEFGVTTVFGGVGLGGTENFAQKLASPVMREAAAKSIGQAWKNLGKNLGETVISEVPEEALITALDSVHVQQKLNPQMTDADVRKAIYDTIVSTALTTAPLGGIKAAKEGFTDFRNIPTHDRSTDELKREADSLAETSAKEGLAEEQAAGRDAAPPSAERVAELGAERAQLTEQLRKTPSGGSRWVDLRERILEINNLIGEPKPKSDAQSPQRSKTGRLIDPELTNSVGLMGPLNTTPENGITLDEGFAYRSVSPNEVINLADEGVLLVDPNVEGGKKRPSAQTKQKMWSRRNPNLPNAGYGIGKTVLRARLENVPQDVKGQAVKSSDVEVLTFQDGKWITETPEQFTDRVRNAQDEQDTTKTGGEQNAPQALQLPTVPTVAETPTDTGTAGVDAQGTGTAEAQAEAPLSRIDSVRDVKYTRDGPKGSLVEGLEFIADTSESTVYRDGDTVIKISEPYNDNSEETYRARIANRELIDSELGDGTLQQDGHYLSTNGTKNPIFRQKFYSGRAATDQEIDNHMESRGYQKQDNESYTKEVDGKKYTATDLKDGNVIVDNQGVTHVIDANLSEAPIISEPAQAPATEVTTNTPTNGQKDQMQGREVQAQVPLDSLSPENIKNRSTKDLTDDEVRYREMLRGSVTDPNGQENARLAQEGLDRIREELSRRAADPTFVEPLPAQAETPTATLPAGPAVPSNEGAASVAQPTTTQTNAINQGKQQEGNLGEYPQGNETRKTTEAGDSNRSVSSGQEQQAQEAPQKLTPEVIKSAAPHLSDEVASAAAALFNTIAPDLPLPEVRGQPKAPKMTQGELFQQENGPQPLPEAEVPSRHATKTEEAGGLSYAELEAHPTALRKIVNKLRTHKVFRVGPGNVKQAAKRIMDQMVSNILKIHDMVPEDIRNQSKLWYSGANAISHRWSQQFGVSTQAVAGAIAAMSPQKDWFQNVSLAERLLSIWTGQGRETDTFNEDMRDAAKKMDAAQAKAAAGKGYLTVEGEEVPLFTHEARLNKLIGKKFDELEADDVAFFIRLYDSTYNDPSYALVSPDGRFGKFHENKNGSPTRIAWGSNHEVTKAVRILNDPSVANISEQLGKAHKIRSFYNNIVNPDSDETVTSDTHAVAAAYLLPLSGSSMEVSHNFGGTGSGSFKGTYAFIAEAYRRAAAARGIKPSQMQSITWEAIREIFTAASKRNESTVAKIRKLWEDYSRGKTDKSYDETANEAIAAGGGYAFPAWYRQSELGFGDSGTAFDRGSTFTSKRGGAGADGLRSGTGRGDGRGSQPTRPGSQGGAEQGTLFQAEQPQQPRVTRGSITFAADMGKAWITLMQHANASTFPHELAHFLRRFVLADNPEARMAAERRGISVEEIQNLAKWAGVGADGVWTRAAEEKFARGFERYLADGNAPTPQLQALFDKFAAWLKEIYGAIAGTAIDVEISPEAKAVFDKLLAGPMAKPAPQAKTQAKPASAPKVSKPATPVDEISAKREYMDALRRKYGFPQYFPGDPVTDQMVTDEAVQALDAAKNGRPSKYKVGQDLVNELEGRDKGPDAVEVALLVHEAKVLDAKLTRAYNGLEGSNSDRQTNELSADIARMEEQLNAISTLISETGTAAGRMLQSFKKVWDNKFDLVRMTAAYLRDKRAATGDSKATVSPEERKQIREINTRLKERKKALDDAVAAKEKEIRAKEAESMVKNVARDVKDKKAPARANWKKEVRASLDTKGAAERMRARGFGVSLEQSDAGNPTLLQQDLDPETLDDLATIGAGLILDQDLKSIDDFTAAIVDAMGPEAMDYSQEIYQRAQDKIEAARKSRKIPKSPEQLLKEVDPEKELSNRMVFNMVRGYLLQDMDPDKVLKQVHADLQTVWEDISFEEVSDAFTGYGKIKYPSTEEINVQLRHLRNVERIKRQLDVVRSGQVPSKTGFQRDKADAEIRNLQKELKKAMKDAGIKTTRSNQLKSSLDAIKTRFRNELEDLQRAISSRTQLPPKKAKEEYDQETKDLKARVDKKRAEYAAIFENKSLTEKQQLKQALAAIKRSIAEEEDMLAKGILSKPKRSKQVFDDPEFKAAEARLTALREARHAAQRALRPRKSAEQIALEAAIRENKKGLARDEERVRTGDTTSKTKAPRYTPNEELKAILAERSSLKEILKRQRQQKARLGKPERDAARQEQRAAEAIQRSLDKIEKRIQELASGVVTPPRRVLPFTTPGLSAARAVRDSRRRTMLELEKALRVTKSAEQIREERMVKAANAKKLRYQEMIAKGILTKPTRVSAPVSEAVDKARYEAAQVEAEWNKLRAKMLWANRTLPSKVWSRVKTGLRATGVLRLGGDLGLLRQGGVWALSNFWRHPVKTASALARVARHGMTERGAYEIYQASQEALNTAGFTEKDIRLLNPIEPPGTGGRSRAAEEITGADILDMASKLPKKTVIGLAARGLRAVEFFNTSILNIARVETALALRGSLDLPMSDNVRKAISVAAEVSSGRGYVKPDSSLEAAIPFLNDWVFISARWTISRIQMATGYPLWSTKMSFETRAKLFHEIYLKTLIGRALMASAIAALFPPKDDEDLEEFIKRVAMSMGIGNPLDPNYGKLKLKNGFSLDLAQGISPLAGVFARVTTGRTIRDGKLEDLRDEEKGRIVENYLKNRANMVTASLVRTLITGRAYGGERLPSISRIYRTLEGTEEYPVNGPMLGEVAKEWFAPIILADTKRIYQEFGPKGLVLWATMMSGAGVQSYQPKPKKEKFY